MRKRWLVYFDILGFSDLIEGNSPFGAIDVYEKCLDEFRWHETRNTALEFVHFSDTFLIFAPDDSLGSFGRIESASRWFLNILLLKQIPLRGASSCNDFFADKAKNIFLGKALVEASKFGERYNWIGFALAPSAIARLDELNCPVRERLNYRLCDIPVRATTQVEYQTEPGAAYLIGASSPVNGENQYLSVLSEMAARVKRPEIKLKYKNTLSFLEHFGVLRIIPNIIEKTTPEGS